MEINNPERWLHGTMEYGTWFLVKNYFYNLLCCVCHTFHLYIRKNNNLDRVCTHGYFAPYCLTSQLTYCYLKLIIMICDVRMFVKQR